MNEGSVARGNAGGCAGLNLVEEVKDGIKPSDSRVMQDETTETELSGFVSWQKTKNYKRGKAFSAFLLFPSGI